MATVPCFDETQLEQICKVLGETASGSEISTMLAQLNIPDDNPKALSGGGFRRPSANGNGRTAVEIASWLSCTKQ
jgi:hypothetical protein